jgi:hypothetical protein
MIFTKNKSMSNYRYKGTPEERVFGALPAGDYNYVVSEAHEPYTSKNGNEVLKVRLSVGSTGATVWAHPWCGVDKNGEQRDGIAEFLASCNRLPRIGEEPDWRRLHGARGRCRLKVEIAALGALAGKEVNAVDRFYRPKEVGPAAEGPRQNFSKQEVAAGQGQAERRAGKPRDPELDAAPEDIPF